MKEMSREEALARIEFRVRCACPQANGDNIGECNGCWRYPCNDMKAVNLLAQERPYGEWIPCSERLPDKEEKIYLVTIDYGNGLSCIAPRFFWNKERLWNEAEEYITAWMPLPEPYKEGGDSDA